MSDHELLGVADDATKAEIKEAFRRLALEKHPDRGGDGEEFARLRAAHDRMMAQAPDRRACTKCKGVGRRRVQVGWDATTINCDACKGSGVAP